MTPIVTGGGFSLSLYSPDVIVGGYPQVIPKLWISVWVSHTFGKLRTLVVHVIVKAWSDGRSGKTPEGRWDIERDTEITLTSGLQLLHGLLLKQWKDSDYQADFVAGAGQLVQELLKALEDSGESMDALGKVLTDHQADSYYATQRTLDVYCAELLAGRMKATPEGFAHVAYSG